MSALPEETPTAPARTTTPLKLIGENKLPPKQQRALITLLSSNTIAEAAKACRMNEATLYRFLQDKTFKAQYRMARGLIVEHAIMQLQRDCEAAARTL